MTAPEAIAIVKPRLRGVIHQYAFFVALVVGALLLAFAPSGEGRVAIGIYAVTLAGLFGISALYHRVNWSPGARRWMRRLDHSMIFVFIAGTYTPFALLVLDGTFSTVVLAGMWGGALGGVILQLVWTDAPRWVAAGVYIGLGWLAVGTLPELLGAVGAVAVGLISFGGVLYTIGGVVHATQRPDPVPAVFGFHEVFHTLTVVAAAAQCAAIAFWVLPRG